VDGVAAKQPGAALARAVASLYRLGCERPLVERNQQPPSLDPRASTAAAGSSWASDANSARPIPAIRAVERERAADDLPARATVLVVRTRTGLTTGIDAARRLVTLDLQASRDRVLRVDLQRGVERRRRSVELPALEVAP
jgi:hypothetical protein